MIRKYHNLTLQSNPDKTKICLDIGPALLVSKHITPATTDQTVLVYIPHDLYSMFYNCMITPTSHGKSLSHSFAESLLKEWMSMKKVSMIRKYHNLTLQSNPDKTKICLDIGPALLVSKHITLCIAGQPRLTDQTVLVYIPHDLYSMF